MPGFGPEEYLRRRGGGGGRAGRRLSPHSRSALQLPPSPQAAPPPPPPPHTAGAGGRAQARASRTRPRPKKARAASSLAEGAVWDPRGGGAAARDAGLVGEGAGGRNAALHATYEAGPPAPRSPPPLSPSPSPTRDIARYGRAAAARGRGLARLRAGSGRVLRRVVAAEASSTLLLPRGYAGEVSANAPTKKAISEVPTCFQNILARKYINPGFLGAATRVKQGGTSSWLPETEAAFGAQACH